MADFRQLQQQWTAWLRQPEQQPAPVNIEARRLAIYRELFFNNVSNFIENAFPVMQQRLQPEHWQSLVQDFFALHRCHSPYFHDTANEFLSFLSTQHRWLPVYPWLIELAHFEWVELAADIAEADMPAYGAGDLLKNIPVVNPCAWPLAYHWPVHTFDHQAPASEPLATPVCLIVYRNLADDVGFIEVNPLTARLLEKLQQNRQQTAMATLQELALEQSLDASALQASGADALQALLASQIILGVRSS